MHFSVHTGGILSMRIFFGEDYPSKPPKVRFTCDMFHPNGNLVSATQINPTPLTIHPSNAVYSDGVLCLDIIQDQWKPIYTVASILTSIQVKNDLTRFTYRRHSVLNVVPVFAVYVARP